MRSLLMRYIAVSPRASVLGPRILLQMRPVSQRHKRYVWPVEFHSRICSILRAEPCFDLGTSVNRTLALKPYIAYRGACLA